MGLLTFPGAGRVLGDDTSWVLPQPDQLCGPFSAVRALRAVLDDPPSVTDLAVVSGSRVWPHDVPAWRPAGSPLLRAGWDRVAVAATPDAAGTDATGLARGVAALCHGVTVVPVRGGDRSGLGALLAGVSVLDHPVGVLANLRTGPVAPPGLTWDVGHFVVLWGLDGEQVGVVDTYAELGAPGEPAGCRLVDLGALTKALADRGLLLLVADAHAAGVRRLVDAVGLESALWAT